MKNTVFLGDSETILKGMEPGIDLVFCSPPYFNARDYASYDSYPSYLSKLQRVFQECHRVLKEGCFLVVNSSPVLVPRMNRAGASKRLPIPFDLHREITSLGFEFIEDIVWVKPEGAGWASGRGRRFSADRNPLQYKCVPVTEYLFVYRKETDKLIDWNIRQHDRKVVKDSKIDGEYDITNVWQLPPANHPIHPAVFPIALAEKVIRYYSFKGDTVLDPFGGTGTTGKAAEKMGRRFVLIEKQEEYFQIIREELDGCFSDTIFERQT